MIDSVKNNEIAEPILLKSDWSILSKPWVISWNAKFSVLLQPQHSVKED